ncbi:MAG: mersacidin/lichenicidin family type 2 lantibiotic [Acidobacteria bacterium]|nr:mersacidin/lichenicidin family type 2 lantibiotic [Acidobacteriota bacterium]
MSENRVIRAWKERALRPTETNEIPQNPAGMRELSRAEQAEHTGSGLTTSTPGSGACVTRRINWPPSPNDPCPVLTTENHTCDLKTCRL